MIKRTVVALSTLSLFFAGTVLAGKHSSHSHSHKHHHVETKTKVDTTSSSVAPANVQVVEIDNKDLCFHYVSDTLFILKGLIMRDTNYEASRDGMKVEFNICNPLVLSDS